MDIPRVAVAILLFCLPVTVMAQAHTSRIVRLLEEYAGAVPSAGEVIIAGGESPEVAIRALHKVLGETERRELWPGAIFACGVLGSRASTQIALSEIGRLEKFLVGRKFTDISASPHDAAVGTWEDMAKLMVPTAISYLAAHDPAPSKGNELHGRSGPQPATSLDLLARILTGETKPKWSASNEDNSLELRFRALRGLIDSGRQDALARIEESKSKLSNAPTLASEATLALKNARWMDPIH